MSLTAIAVGVGTQIVTEVGKNVGVTGASSAMDVARGTLKVLAAASDGSLVGVTQSARVEPITLIDSSLNGHPSLTPLLQCLQSCFTAYWLQALAMTTNIGGISVAGKLDPLSTSRDPLNSFIVANESYHDALPFYDGSKGIDISDNKYLMNIANEAISNETVKAQNAKRAAGGSNEKSSLEISKDPGISDASNLITGKLFNVTVTHNNSSAVIPIAVRLSCMYMNDTSMSGLVSGLTADYSLKERMAQLRHGGISFWRDFILCQDIIDEHKKNLDADKSGIYMSMMQRRADNNAAALASGGNVSLNNASNLVVMSKETLEMAEAKSGIDFASFNQRQKVFQQGYMMMIAVMDRRWSRVTVYTRGIRDTTTVSFADLKSASKGDGPDVADILSAFRAGTSATL